jgi:hypothetical protein
VKAQRLIEVMRVPFMIILNGNINHLLSCVAIISIEAQSGISLHDLNHITYLCPDFETYYGEASDLVTMNLNIFSLFTLLILRRFSLK